ncbi:MAG: class I SAM-dependent methyltransferase [Eggerthellaceae bacterium]|nr:class I SAM-dependent methyltransferase [Eggerthellaceae bacterium]
MESEVVRALNGLNRRFYERFGTSFGETRQTPWPGWDRLADLLRSRGWDTAGRPIRVLDAGCGNCRFERFLLERFPQVRWEFLLLDAAEEPSSGEARKLGVPTAFVFFDVVEGLLAGEALPFAEADLTVAFGLLHHVPSAELRARFLKALKGATRPEGTLAVSLWQFLDDAGLAAKARETTAAAAPYLTAAGIDPAALEPGDCILGWQDASFDEGALRYCHHFTDGEIDSLAEGAVLRYRADGRTGKLNTYLVWAGEGGPR